MSHTLPLPKALQLFQESLEQVSKLLNMISNF